MYVDTTHTYTHTHTVGSLPHAFEVLGNELETRDPLLRKAWNLSRTTASVETVFTETKTSKQAMGSVCRD